MRRLLNGFAQILSVLIVFILAYFLACGIYWLIVNHSWTIAVIGAGAFAYLIGGE